MTLSFALDGAIRHAAALSVDEISILHTLAQERRDSGPGARIIRNPALSSLLKADGGMDRIAKTVLGEAARPVRALLFDKTPDCNWSVGWHQDRTIAVRDSSDVPGFGPWSKKAGVWHVEPPFDFIAKMLTLRAHLDSCDPDNAPLLIAPGSHRLGRIAQSDIPETVEYYGSYACVAEEGDVWLYSTAILHASEKALGDRHRRVLQVDYSAQDLPAELEWFGI